MCDLVNKSGATIEAGGRPAGRMLSLVRALCRDDHGAAAAEFALVAAPLLAILLGCTQVAVLFFAQQSLQTATYTAARLVKTGQAASLSQSAFKQQVCTALPPMFDCNQLLVDVQSSTSFSTLNTQPIQIIWSNGQAANTFAYTPGVQGEPAIIRVMYPWQTVTLPLGNSFNNDGNGSNLLVGTAVVLNEPYPAAGAS